MEGRGADRSDQAGRVILRLLQQWLWVLGEDIQPSEVPEKDGDRRKEVFLNLPSKVGSSGALLWDFLFVVCVHLL